MVNSVSQTNPEIISAFNAISTDQKLALLWFVYKEIGKSITPAAPGASTAAPAVANGLFQQVLEMTHDEQLQIQRDLVDRNNTLICREYGSLSDTTKLLFWYLLAQGMDRQEIIPMPENYELEENAKQCMSQLQQLENSAQITVLRALVADMGVDPESVPRDPATNI
jgi:hypothetical protein